MKVQDAAEEHAWVQHTIHDGRTGTQPPEGPRHLCDVSGTTGAFHPTGVALIASPSDSENPIPNDGPKRPRNSAARHRQIPAHDDGALLSPRGCRDDRSAPNREE